jgi:hypothetical protein
MCSFLNSKVRLARRILNDGRFPVITRIQTAHVALCATLMLVLPVSSRAQTAATSFDELRAVVQDGDKVVVTSSDGGRTRGRLTNLTTSSMVVMTPRFWPWQEPTPRSVADRDVRTVQRIDSTRDGALIGFVAGFLPVLVGACANDDPYVSCAGVLILGGPTVGALGALIGASIDGMLNTTVYRAGTPAISGATVTLSPSVNTKTAGASLRLSLRFF